MPLIVKRKGELLTTESKVVSSCKTSAVKFLHLLLNVSTAAQSRFRGTWHEVRSKSNLRYPLQSHLPLTSLRSSSPRSKKHYESLQRLSYVQDEWHTLVRIIPSSVEELRKVARARKTRSNFFPRANILSFVAQMLHYLRFAVCRWLLSMSARFSMEMVEFLYLGSAGLVS